MNKKIIFLGFLSVVLGSYTAFAQKAKVVSAYNYLRYNELDKAKEAIDAAITDVTTSTMAKTWMYRGQIYSAIASSKEEKFKKLHPNPLEEAFQSFSKAYEFDTKKIDINELNTNFAQLVNPMFTEAINQYNKNEYNNAVTYFEKCVSINKKFNQLDTLSLFNAGLSAEKGKNYDKATTYYKQCIDAGYMGAVMYSNLANVYKLNGQKVAALELLTMGKNKYPGNQDLINFEFSIYLEDNDYEGALRSIDASIKNQPNNAVYHYNKGFLYDQKKDIENAAVSYEKAIQLDASYFDAYYNLGALYFNRGAELINESNDLPLKEAQKSEMLRKEAEVFFQKALPFLEKANELKPDDKNTMISLRNIYARTNQNEKYKMINDKLTN